MSKPTQFREDLLMLATGLLMLAFVAFDLLGAWLMPVGMP